MSDSESRKLLAAEMEKMMALITPEDFLNLMQWEANKLGTPLVRINDTKLKSAIPESIKTGTFAQSEGSKYYRDVCELVSGALKLAANARGFGEDDPERIVICDTSKHPSPSKSKTKRKETTTETSVETPDDSLLGPDFCLYRQKHKDRFSVDDKQFVGKSMFELVLSLIELRIEMLDSPSDHPDTNKEDSSSQATEATRGQIASYLDAICKRQSRVFTYGVVIRKNIANFVRTDQAGTLVSHGVDLDKVPEKFMQFYYYFGQMTDAQLGLDSTMKRATKEDIDLFKGQVAALADADLKKRLEKIIDKSSDEDYYRMLVNAGSEMDTETRWNAQREKTPSEPVDGAAQADSQVDVPMDTDPPVVDPIESTAGNPTSVVDTVESLVDAPAESPVVIPPQIVVNELTGNTYREFIVGRCSTAHSSLTGRGMKGYIALDVSTRQFVFIKDSWRVDYSWEGVIPWNSPLPELVTYARLRRAGVNHIATVICGGDVYPEDLISPQRTVAHRYVYIDIVLYTDKEETKDGKKSGEGGTGDGKKQKQVVAWRVMPRIRTRIVIKEVGRKLSDYKDSKELVSSLRDALIAHKQAWEKAKILHRDISVDNIVIYGSSGILIDWDSSKRKEMLGKGASNIERSGTWTFLSGLALHYPSKPYDVTDDLESFFHIVTWLYLRFHYHSLHPEVLADYLHRFYLESYHSGGSMMGYGKVTIMMSGMRLVTRENRESHFEENPAFAGLISDLIKIFREFYLTVVPDLDLAEDVRKFFLSSKSTILTHNSLLDIFRKALESNEWVPGDKLQDQFKDLPLIGDLLRTHTTTNEGLDLASSRDQGDSQPLSPRSEGSDLDDLDLERSKCPLA